MKLITENHQTKTSYTQSERLESGNLDEQDHMIIWEALISLVPDDRRIDLVTACESVARYIKDQREAAIRYTDKKARFDEVDGLLGRLKAAYPFDADTSVFSSEAHEYRIVSERYKILAQQARTSNGGSQLKHAA